MRKYETGATTKQKIIQAAGELIGELGIDNVSTRAVAKRSGENIGSIHYHFGGKDGLLKAALRKAKSCCMNKDYETPIGEMTEQSSPKEFSDTVRLIVKTEIKDLFCSNRPYWHTQLIYQVMQRDDELSDLMFAEMMDPNMEVLTRFFSLINPSLTDEEAVIHVMTMLMPVWSHSTYIKALHRSLNVTAYSESYLQKLEDLLVKQTQLLLGLPLDK